MKIELNIEELMLLYQAVGHIKTSYEQVELIVKLGEAIEKAEDIESLDFENCAGGTCRSGYSSHHMCEGCNESVGGKREECEMFYECCENSG